MYIRIAIGAERRPRLARREAAGLARPLSAAHFGLERSGMTNGAGL